MPCRDYYMEDQMKEQARKRCDDATKAACEALTILDEFFVGRRQLFNPNQHLTADTRKWWEDHQEADRRRIAAERKAEEDRRVAKNLKKSALSKLTDAEKKALRL
jgi:hypothetical protein